MVNVIVTTAVSATDRSASVESTTRAPAMNQRCLKLAVMTYLRMQMYMICLDLGLCTHAYKGIIINTYIVIRTWPQVGNTVRQISQQLFLPQWMPHTIIIGSKPPYKVVGSLVEVMSIVAEKLGVCVEYVVPEDRIFGTKAANGSWSGVMGLVVREEVDMTGAVLSQEAGRSEAVDFSIPLYMDAQRIIYKSPVLTSDIAGFIKPYSGLMWSMLVASMVLLITGIFLVQAIHNKAARGRQNVERSFGTVWQSCQWILGAALAQSMVHVPSGTAVRVLWGMWLLAALIVGSVYRSNLKAMLILPKLRLPFDNVNELTQTDIPCLVPAGSALMHIILSAPPGSQLHKLHKQLLITNNVDKAVQGIIDGKVAVFSSEHLLNFVIHLTFSRTQSCPLYYASETFFGATSLSLAFPKGSPLKKKIDPILYNLQEFGILNKLYKDGVQNLRECLKQTSSNSLRSFDLIDFYGIFCVYLGAFVERTIPGAQQTFFSQRMKRLVWFGLPSPPLYRTVIVTAVVNTVIKRTSDWEYSLIVGAFGRELFS
ncbi:glutamate receptor-like [Penaeus monodon]|uniref:glutamate receptor-like n=1 Tax=Penaeus monodon TaxID=6687 RepID=UPI0018A77E64|nr:glutamate receptor-like [Penaeus monodon]